jgi:hypothetical protein
VRYLADLPALKRGFGELGPDGWRDLISGKRGPHASLAAEAWPLYIAEYGLGQGEGQRIPQLAAREYMAALRAGLVPQWVQDMGLLAEIKAATGGE